MCSSFRCVSARRALRVPQGYVDGKWYCDVSVWRGEGGGMRATQLRASKSFNKEMALRLVLPGIHGMRVEYIRKYKNEI